jgi:hypothetical protein
MFRKLVLALAAPLLLIAGCASESDGGGLEVQTGAAAVAELRGAPDAASEAGTAAFEMVMTMTGLPGLGEDAVELTATGSFDADAQQMAMEMDLGAMFEGLAEATGETVPPEMAQPVRFVADGTTFYLRIPILDALTGSSGWLSMSADDLGQSAGSLGLGAGAFDPSKMLEVLRGTSDDVQPDGQEDVRGVATTKYTATVNMADALESVPADQRDELEAQLDQLGAGDADIPIEIWVDADGLPRRFSLTFGDLAAEQLSDDGTMAMTMEFFDYGEPVSIELPSPDDVTPFRDVMGGLGLDGEGS